MKWFGLKAGRDDARPALSRAGGAHWSAMQGGEAPWAQGYEAQVRAGYLGNAVAQRAVKLVAEGIGGAPLDASDARLVTLMTGRASGRRLIETVAAQLMLHGNAFVQVLRDADGGLAALYPLRPERVGVVADASGWPAGYRYTVAGRASVIAPDDVIHVRDFHPLDDHLGSGYARCRSCGDDRPAGDGGRSGGAGHGGG